MRLCWGFDNNGIIWGEINISEKLRAISNHLIHILGVLEEIYEEVDGAVENNEDIRENRKSPEDPVLVQFFFKFFSYISLY